MERVCPVDALLVMGAAQVDGVRSGAFERRLAGALRLAEAGCAETVVVGVQTRAGRPACALREVVATIAYRLGALR